MLRAYHPEFVAENAATITLAKEESFHLVKVLRAKKNEPVTAFDGCGHFYKGKILDGNATALTISIEERYQVPAPHCKISLAQALPKGALMDDIVRQATEIGVSRIFPILSSRCEVKLDAPRAAHKLERWNSIAIEASKQSGNPFLPQILPIQSFKKFIETPCPDILALTASLEAGTRHCPEIALDCAKNPPLEILWLVGPEGDFTEEEYALARTAGFLPARLGENVLRAVTAAIYALTAADQMRQTWLKAC